MISRFGLKYLLLLVFAGLLSCKSNVICPAFQSTYILDDSLRLLAFSPFGADSMPKYGSWVKKNKNGIIAPEPYWRKNYEMRIVRMENQLPPPAVDATRIVDEPIIAGMPSPDSLMVESDSSMLDKPATAPAPPKEPQYIRKYNPKDNFNQDQDFYNKHFGELFVPKKQPQSGAGTVQQKADSTAFGESKEKKGLFNRRKRDEADEDVPLIPADSTGS